nr:hypothetical protein [Tanacetum cinerariifolium]
MLTGGYSVEKDDDSFTKVTCKNGKAKQDGKFDQLVLICNSFEKLMESDKLLVVADITQATPTCTKDTSTDLLEDDEEEVKDIYTKPDPNISKQPRTNGNKEASTPNDAVKDVINDNNLCLCAILESHVANSNLQGSGIILGWNPNIVKVVVILYDAQVMHVCVYFKDDKKELIFSFVYAYNQYMQRRDLWRNLTTHKAYFQNRPWCILGDFNVSLSVDDKSTGTSYIDTSMRDFQECINDLKLLNVNCTGLRFTWNQKPKGGDGILKKIDQKTSVSGFWMFKVVKHLKLLKKPLRKLLYDHKNFHENVKRLRHELDEAQKPLDLDPSNFELREEEVAYLQAFNDASLMEEVTSHASRNRIDSVTTAKGICIDGDQVHVVFIDHYTAFLGQQGVPYSFGTTDLFYNQLTNDTANHMVHDVTDKEIQDAIFSMGDNKASGPDGYFAAFFKEAWDIIAAEVTKVIREFFTNGILLKKINHTIISLIPKVTSPMKINDYRLISYWNVLFKCISKIISNHMKESLSDLVSLNQLAFVLGRRILDNILLTQELMHNYHLDRGTPRCAFKIMKCVTSMYFSLSINGCLHGYFKGKRGLRQRDPMSPYLFTLVMEVLTLMLHQRAQESNSFTYHQYFSKLNIINLCFADDLFLFAHGDVSFARVIMDSLEEFKNASGLTPSLPKSTAYFCIMLNHVKLDIIYILPFEEGKLPVKYFGVPLVPSRLVHRYYSKIIEKDKRRISDWKNKSLSLAGRAQLIRFVLFSMHIYWALVFILLTSLMVELEQVMRGFLWCQGEMHKGRAKIAWEDVCLPKDEGGLGIRRLKAFNKALISSHIWSLLSHRDSLWVKWIHAYKLTIALFGRCLTVVWEHLKRFTGMSNIPYDLNSIVDFLIPLAKMRSVRSVIAKLVFAASCYFIWQERNFRILMKKKRSQDQVIDIIMSTNCLKLLTCKFKKTTSVIHLSKLPTSLIGPSRIDADALG